MLTIWNKTIQGLFLAGDLQSALLGTYLVSNKYTVYWWMYTGNHALQSLGLPGIGWELTQPIRTRIYKTICTEVDLHNLFTGPYEKRLKEFKYDNNLE